MPAFNNLGAVAKIGTDQGEYIRLFLMLQSIKRSGAKEQHSNVVESSIIRLKKLWRSSQKFLPKLEGYSQWELDFMLELLCSTLNNQPLDPEQTQICPGDFLSGYRAIPLPLQYHDTKRNFEKIREGYEELRKHKREPDC